MSKPKYNIDDTVVAKISVRGSSEPSFCHVGESMVIRKVEKTPKGFCYTCGYDGYELMEDEIERDYGKREGNEKMEQNMEMKETKNVRVVMEITTKDTAELQRMLDHHMEYLMDFENNRDVVESVSGVISYDKELGKDNLLKMQALCRIVEDVLETKPSNEELENKCLSMRELYIRLHELNECLKNISIKDM